MYAEQDDDWQSRKSVVECNRHMWRTKEASDIIFIVGQGANQERVEAHKYVLISRSRVFFAMLAGPLSGNTQDVVDIPDLDAETFNSLLLFLYCDEVKVDLDNVLALLYAAKKYCIQSLIDKCLNKLKSNMVASNVSTVMETAHMYGNDELVSRCKAMILQDPSDVFRSESFVELCSDCLASILREDMLCAREDEIFNAVMKYSADKCEQKGLEVTAENRIQELGTVLREIRFPLMESDYFVDHVETSGLLTERECIKLMRHFLKKQGEVDGFNNRPRKNRSTIIRFDEQGGGWGYKRDKVDEISFRVSEAVMICGVQLYGSCQASCTYEVKLKLMQEPYRGIMKERKAMLETDGAQKLNTLVLSSVFMIEQGGGWGYKRDKVDEISFRVSEAVMICGVQLYGSCQASCTYEVKLKLMQEPYRGIMKERKAMLETDGAQKLYTLMFSGEAVRVEKDKTYTFQLFLRGQESFSGEVGAEEVEKDGVKFTFIDSKSSTNNTTVKRGQIPGIVFEKVPAEAAQQ